MTRKSSFQCAHNTTRHKLFGVSVYMFVFILCDSFLMNCRRECLFMTILGCYSVIALPEVGLKKWCLNSGHKALQNPSLVSSTQWKNPSVWIIEVWNWVISLLEIDLIVWLVNCFLTCLKERPDPVENMVYELSYPLVE